jgi:hypothetical protein
MPVNPLQISATNKKWANRPPFFNRGESLTKNALESNSQCSFPAKRRLKKTFPPKAVSVTRRVPTGRLPTPVSCHFATRAIPQKTSTGKYQTEGLDPFSTWFKFWS